SASCFSPSTAAGRSGTRRPRQSNSSTPVSGSCARFRKEWGRTSATRLRGTSRRSSLRVSRRQLHSRPAVSMPASPKCCSILSSIASFTVSVRPVASVAADVFQQAAFLEGLAQVVVHTDGISPCAVLVANPGGNHDDRDVADRFTLRAYVRGEFEAIHLRHL